MYRFLLLLNLLLLSIAVKSAHAQDPRPDTTSFKAQIFMPGLISLPDRYEFGITLNAEETELYFGVDTGSNTVIYFSKRTDGSWSKPVLLVSHPEYSHNDPMLSPKEDKLYFISDRPLPGETEAGDYNIWYIRREGTGWSEPVSAGPEINSAGHEYYISFNAAGDMYFGSNRDAEADRSFNFDIYKSAYTGGSFRTPVALDTTVNTPRYEADVFVAPDERYLVFSASRQNGYGEGDLYISFRDENGSWTEALNMEELINTTGHELCPFVSNDGRFFYFTSNRDIMRVDARILETYR